jgi:protein ImuB
MAIPSYDDLTPSIPDVSPGEVFASVADVLPKPERQDRDSGLGTRGSVCEPETRESRAPNSEREAPSPEPRIPSPELYAALHDADDAGIERLLAIARDFSPRIERRRGGTVVLDVSGLQRLFGEPRSIAEHLARAGAPQVAIAVSQTAAILLARTGRGIAVAVEDPESALRDVPLSVLQQFVDQNELDPRGFPPRTPLRRRSRGPERPRSAPAGAPLARPQSTGAASRTADHGPQTPDHDQRTLRLAAARRVQTFDVLQRWGLTTIGEFAALPAADLSARLGPAGIVHQRLARGLDPRPLIPDPGVRRFVESFELEWPIELLEPLSFVFARLLEPLAAALETADRGGVALRLQLRLTNRTTYARTLGLPAPMRDPRVLRTLLLLDLESHPPPAAVDIVTIEIDPAPGRIVQYSLLERPVPSPETLATLMARLGALVGESRCGSPAILDTHRPDGWTMKPVSFADSTSALPATVDKRDELPSDSADKAAMSEAQPSRMALRRFRPPVAVRVAVEKGRPASVAIDRRGMPGGIVRQAAGPWRSSGNWWDGQRWNRDEWDVAFEDGAVCRIFQEREGRGWFVDGVYD